MTIEVAIVADVTLRVQTDQTNQHDAQEQAQAAAGAAVRDALASGLLAHARALRDALEPCAHALRVYTWIGHTPPELMTAIEPPEET